MDGREQCGVGDPEPAVWKGPRIARSHCDAQQRSGAHRDGDDRLGSGATPASGRLRPTSAAATSANADAQSQPRRQHRPRHQPPPAPEPKEEDVKGRIDNLFGVCPEVWFSVDGRLVHTTGGTDYKHGDSCRDLRERRNVTVKGTSQVLFGRDYLLAGLIDIKK